MELSIHSRWTFLRHVWSLRDARAFERMVAVATTRWSRQRGMGRLVAWQNGRRQKRSRGRELNVIPALSDRLCGFPILAPYFHFAFGWSIAITLQFSRFPTSIFAVIPCVLFGPALHLIWYQPIHFAKYAIGATAFVSAPCIMGICIVGGFAFSKA